MARTRILFACLALAAPLIPAPAYAAPATGLVLSVRSEMGLFSTTQLKCEPAGGQHQYAQEACDSLAAVDGDFREMPDGGLICTMQFEPVTASLRGKWRGKKVTYTQEYSNPCVMNSFTGKVFEF